MGKIFEAMKSGRQLGDAPRPIRTDGPHTLPAGSDVPLSAETLTATTRAAEASQPARVPFAAEDQVPFIEIPETAAEPTEPAESAATPDRELEKKARFLASPWPGDAPATCSEGLPAKTDAETRLSEHREIFRHLDALLGPRSCSRVLLVPAPEVDGASLAIHLAMAAAAIGRQPVLLIDASRQSGGIGACLGLPESPGWEELIAGLEPAQVVQFSGCFGVDAVPSGRRLAATNSLLWARRTRDLVHEFAERYRWLIFLGPPLNLGPWWLLLASEADGVCLVVNHSTDSRARETAQAALAHQASPFLGTILLG